MAEKLLTIREAASRLAVHENTIRNWSTRGLIHLRRFPSGIHRVPEHEVRRLEAAIFPAPSSFPDDVVTAAPKSVHDTAQDRVQGSFSNS